MVYLIHFSEAFKHARHYLGYAADLDARLERHRDGNGAKLLAVLKSAGINWQVVRTWPGSRKFERQLKNRHNAKTLCPECSGEKANGRGNYESNKK